jgi:tetratricopeptide (TPR) repeat protein
VYKRQDQYAASFGEAATVNNAHSWPLQYLATLGVPGATLLFAALVMALIRGRPRLPVGAAPEAMPSTVLMSGIWLGCLGLVVHLQFNVAVLGLSIPLWVLLAVTGAPRASEVRVGPKSLTAAGALFAALALCAAIASTSLIAADRAYLESRQAYHETDWERAIARAETAQRLNPLSVKYARGAAQARAGRVFSAIAQETAPAAVVELHAAAIEEFEYLNSTHPNDYAGWAWRAALQAQTGVYTGNDNLLRDAIESANRAATLDRQHAEVTAIANGDVSPEAVLRANNVLPLP